MKTMFLTLGFLLSPIAFAADATQIVQSVLAKIAPRAYTADLEFVNYRTDGTTSRYVLGLSSLELVSAFLEFQEPAREKGRQILNNDGEIWSYLPDSRKVIRLTDRDSIANGDFNNADVLRLNWLKDYNPELKKESGTQYVIDLNAKSKSATYYKIRLWVNKADGQPIQQMFYDEGGHHMKTLKYGQVTAFPTVTRPAVMTMENVQTGQRTVLTMKAFDVKASISPSRFRPENLGK